LRRISEKIIERALDEVRQGNSIGKTAKKYGMSKVALFKHCKKNNVISNFRFGGNRKRKNPIKKILLGILLGGYSIFLIFSYFYILISYPNNIWMLILITLGLIVLALFLGVVVMIVWG